MWDPNLGDQILNNKLDNYYYSNDILNFSCKYIIKKDDNINFLNYNLNNETNNLINNIVDWNIISNYIIYIKNKNKNKNKIIIFYDSFLINILPLFFDLFEEIYLIKSTYNNVLINKINPNFIFEFRVERFLR